MAFLIGKPRRMSERWRKGKEERWKVLSVELEHNLVQHPLNVCIINWTLLIWRKQMSSNFIYKLTDIFFCVWIKSHVSVIHTVGNKKYFSHKNCLRHSFTKNKLREKFFTGCCRQSSCVSLRSNYPHSLF